MEQEHKREEQEQTRKHTPACEDGQYYEVDRPDAPRRSSRRYGGELILVVVLVVVLSVTAVTLQTHLISAKTITFEENPSSVMAASPETANPAPERADTPAAEIEPEQEGAETEPLAPTLPEDEQTPPAQSGETLSLPEIYRRTIPSVVSIEATLPGGVSSGTGIIMQADGYIITNCHVVSDAVSVSVLLSDDREFAAQLIGSDEISDLALLKIDAADLTPATFGDSDALQVGETVVAIGDPLGSKLRGTMTDGIISAINRDIETEGRTMTLLQTNAALNEGNSGGPLLNSAGEVIGINTMKLSSTYATTVEGLGFAIPINTAQPILRELQSQGYVSGRPSLGMSGISVPLRAQFYYGWPAGVYIQEVEETSDAFAKGIRTGDIIVRADGQEISGMEQLEEIRNAFSAGDELELVVFRGGSYYRLRVTLAEQKVGP